MAGMAAVVTQADAKEGYEDESLADAMKSNDSCRHVARIVHLYLARTKHLSGEDLVVHLPVLFDKLFGKVDEEARQDNKQRNGSAHVIPERYWLETICTDAPQLCEPDIVRNLAQTFDKNRHSRERLSAFRVFHLLMPNQAGSLFDRCVRPSSDSEEGYSVFFLSLRLLPPLAGRRLTDIMDQLSASVGPNYMGSLPQTKINLPFYGMLRFSNRYDLLTRHMLPVTLHENFVIRFLTHFCFGNDSDAYLPSKPVTGPLSQTNGKPAVPESRRQKPFMRLSTWRGAELLYKNPPLELLAMYLRDQLPLDASKQMESGYLFLEAICHLWLLRNVDPFDEIQQGSLTVYGGGPTHGQSSGPNQIVAATRYMGGGAVSYSSVQSNMPRGGDWSGPPAFLPPTVDLLKAISVFLRHVFSAPELDVKFPPLPWESRKEVPPQVQLRGATALTRKIRRPFFQFLAVSLDKTEKEPSLESAGFHSVVDIWLAYLQPWKVAALKRPASSQNAPNRGFHSFTEGVMGALGTGPATRKQVAEPKAAGGPAQANTARQEPNAQGGGADGLFAPGWLWFVVQNYLVYAHMLQVVFRKFEAATMTSTDKQMATRMFSPEGPFSDPVVCILRACEIIVEDKELQRAPRPLIETVARSFMWLEAGLSAPPPGKHTMPTTRGAHVLEVCRAVLSCMDEVRDDVYSILNQQFADLRWRVQDRLIPALLDSAPSATVILAQMLKPQARPRRSNGQETNKGAMNWLGGIMGGPAATTASAAEREVRAATRMHHIFGIPIDNGQRLSHAHEKGTIFGGNDSLAAPQTSLTLGSPAWLREVVLCRYRRLTALGRAQLDSGARACKNSRMEYVGDPLINPPPICSYELGFMVHLTWALSVWLNKTLKLDSFEYDTDASITEQYDGRFRVNLRFLADIRNLLFGTVMAILLNAVALHLPIYTVLFSTVLLLVLSLSANDLVLWAAVPVVVFALYLAY